MKQLLLILLFSPLFTEAQIIVTAAGGGIVLGDGGPATAAELSNPFGVALDNSGNLYVSDWQHFRIRKVSPAYGGTITTIAGNGTTGYSGDGGLGTDAQLGGVFNLSVDHYGNVYVADAVNNCIRKITPLDTITTIAGTGTAGYNGDGIPATAARLNVPGDVAVDSMGNIYIADIQNHRIRMVDTAGVIHTIAGTGIDGFSPDGSLADTAQIEPWCIRVDNMDNIYYGDSFRIRKIDTVGIITTIAGNGISGFSGDGGAATDAQIGGGGGIFVDIHRNIYIADAVKNRVREVNAAGGIIYTIVDSDGAGVFGGDGGPPLLAKLDGPSGVVVDDSGDIYIGDQGNDRVRLVTNHPLSVKNVAQNKQSINVYPNPCNNRCTIQISSVINEQIQVGITNLIGVEVGRFNMFTNQPFTFKTDWAAGVYCIKVVSSGEEIYHKLIIQ